MADISNHLIEFSLGEAVTVPTAIESLNLPNIPLGFIERVPPDACAACPKSLLDGAEHPCFTSLRLADDNAAIAWAFIFQIQNDINANIRAFQTIKDLMRFAAHGTNQGITAQNKTNTSIVAQYPLYGLAGNVLTLTYADGTPNPLAVPYVSQTPNPDYDPGLSVSGVPALLTTTAYTRIRAGARAYFQNCVLEFHNGVRVRRLDIADGIGIGDTFDVILDNDLDLSGLNPYPFDTADQPAVSLEFYIGPYAEPMIEPRDVSTSQFVEAASKTFSLPHVGNFTLEAGAAIHVPDSTPSPFFRAIAYVGATPFDFSAQARTGIIITHASGYAAEVDMSAVDLSACDSITFNYYKFSGSTNAKFVGCHTCSHYKIDHSGSYSHPGATGYCDVAAVASGIGDFHDECYLYGSCNAYSKGSPTNPLDRDIWRGILASLPWIQEQFAPGFDATRFLRVGETSLKALCSELVISHPPAGWHSIREWQGLGGWTQQAIVGSVLAEVYGFETLWKQALEYGPAGENIPSRKSYLDPYEPSGLDIGSPGTGGWDQHVYDHDNIANGGGYHQRCGHLNFQVVIPNINKSIGQMRFPGGTIYFGYWNEFFAQLPDATGAVYLTMVQFLAANKFRRKGNPVWSKDKGTFSIVSVGSPSGGAYPLDLKNRAISASSLSSATEERSSTWLSSGTNVAQLPQHRVNNYDCEQSVRGPQDHLLKVGDCVIIPEVHPEFKFAIVAASAATGAIQDFYPGQFATKLIVPGVLFYVELDVDAVISSVEVTRNTEAVTLDAIAGSTVPPYHLDKDQYWYNAVVDRANNRQRIYFKFAAGNMTGDSIDYNMIIHVVTDIGAGATAFDARNDATYGAAHNCIYVWEVESPFVSISLARFHYQMPDGSNESFDLTPVAAKATLAEYADNEYSITETAPDEWEFTFSPNLMGGRVEFRATVEGDNYGGFGSDNAFYNAMVATLHGASLPGAPAFNYNGESYATYGARADQIAIQDCNNFIADWIAGGGVLAGQSFTAGTNLVATEDKPTFARAVANSEDADVAISESDVTWFGATGRAYLKVGVLDGQCLYVDGLKLAVRDLQAIKAELDAPARTIEKMLDGGLSISFGVIPALVGFYASTMGHGSIADNDAVSIVYPPTEEAVGSLANYGTVGTVPNALGGGMFFAPTDLYPLWTTFFDITIAGFRSAELDRLGDMFKGDNLVEAKANVTFGDIPEGTIFTMKGFTNGNSGVETGQVGVTNEIEMGVYWHEVWTSQAYDGELNGLRISLVGINFDGAGGLYTRSIGASLPFTPSLDTQAIDITQIVENYFAYGKGQFAGFAWVMLPNFLGDIDITGTSLEESLGVIRAATLFVTTPITDGPPGFERLLLGEYTTSTLSWQLPISIAFGKVTFSGIETDIGGLMYHEINDLISRGKGYVPSVDPETIPPYVPTGTPLADKWDWREHDGVTPVQDQENLGTCWAFATIAAVESAYLIQNEETIDLSEQWLIEASNEGDEDGGDLSFPAFISGYGDSCGSHGGVLEEDSPWIGDVFDLNCPYVRSVELDNYYLVGYTGGSDPNHDEIKDAIRVSPVAAAIYASPTFEDCDSWDIIEEDAGGPTNHLLLIVGYDDTTTPPCYIIKNSWGIGWGVGGFARVAQESLAIGVVAVIPGNVTDIV